MCRLAGMPVKRHYYLKLRDRRLAGYPIEHLVVLIIWPLPIMFADLVTRELEDETVNARNKVCQLT